LKFGIKLIDLGPVSDPDHHRYGQYLTAAEVDDLVRPHEDSLSFVMEWLLYHGIAEAEMTPSIARDWIILLLPISKIEILLQTEYFVFGSDDGVEVIRAPKWSLPQHLHDHIEVIQPTNSFFHASTRTRISV
jgi:tripeptidyl-peptidase-1